MTWLQKIGNWLIQTITGVSKSVIQAPESLINKATGAGLTGAEREANEFTASMQEDSQAFSAEQAALQRDWSAQEAERARDWNEQMYEKYNSLQGKIAQAEQAGVNPIYAVTGNAVSPMQTGASAPSGASASSGSSGSVSPTGHGLTDLFGSIMGLMKMKSEIANIEADTKEKEANANKIDKETSWMDKLNEEKLLLSQTQRDNLDAQLYYLETQANYISGIADAESRLKKAQAFMAEWQEKNKELFKGLEIGSDLLSTLANVGVGIMNAKSGLKMANRPLVVGSDAMVFHPADIVH